MEDGYGLPVLDSVLWYALKCWLLSYVLCKFNPYLTSCFLLQQSLIKQKKLIFIGSDCTFSLRWNSNKWVTYVNQLISVNTCLLCFYPFKDIRSLSKYFHVELKLNLKSFFCFIIVSCCFHAFLRFPLRFIHSIGFSKILVEAILNPRPAS
jgi:hypothetical protein